MARRSPLRGAQGDSVSVCGKLLRNRNTITVPESAIGSREKALQAKGKISIRTSNKAGKVQVTCTLGG